MKTLLLVFLVCNLSFARDNHRRKSTSLLRRISKNRHILSIDEEDAPCPCSGRTVARKCPCKPLSDAKDTGYTTSNNDGAEPNYSVITSSGQVMDGFSTGDSPPLVNESDDPGGENGSNQTTNGTNSTTTETVTGDDSDSSAHVEWTMLANGTNITLVPSGTPQDPPAGFVPVTTGGSIAPVPITDQTLLTVYKGNDASDRPGPLQFGDVFPDFHNGWNIWPNRDIKFLFNDGVSNCAQTIFHIAVSVINEHSCLTLSELPVAPRVEDSVENPILHITEFNPDDDDSDPSPVRPGCSASLGYIHQVGGNEIHFAPGCLNTGTAIHLLLHALGMFHEHQRPDRDNFVNLVSANMDIARLGASASSVKMNAVFGKLDQNSADLSPWVTAVTNRPYDYGSIMHNGPCHYSVNEDLGGSSISGCSLQPTLVGSPQTGLEHMGNPADIGNRLSMSLGDKMTLNAMYACRRPVDGFTVPDSTDVASVEAARCTILDAEDFSWSDRANTVISSSGQNRPVSSNNIKLSADSNTGTSNEESTFKDYLRDAAGKKLIIILCCVLGGIILTALVGAFWWFKKRKTGSRDAVLRSGDNDDITRALRDEGNGDGTDEEVIDEIIERGGPSSNPNPVTTR
jgi:hypothetical protein